MYIITIVNREICYNRRLQISLNSFMVKLISISDRIPGARSVLKFRTLCKVIRLSTAETENGPDILSFVEEFNQQDCVNKAYIRKRLHEL
jgi:hypothetical protein